MTPINTIILFSYIIAFITISTLLAHYGLQDVSGYSSKWQALILGVTTSSLIVIGLHMGYKVLTDVPKQVK